MKELIQNAWMGWQSYIDNGKLAALLLISLMLLWLGQKELRNRYRTLVNYTTVMTVVCICPLTAAALMLYQTKFYDYQWIWGVVPVTIMIALTGTLFWSDLVEKYISPKYGVWKRAGITALLIAIIYMSGRMGNNIWNADEEVQKKEKTVKVLENITENGQNKDINLWAPQEIMEYARALDGSIRLPYGRNMWDAALNAYSYDVYGEVENTLYAWMLYVEQTGEGTAMSDAGEAEQGELITGSECMDIARQLGVNHILLPEKLLPETLAELEAYLGITAERVEEYYLFRVEWRE